MTSDPHFLFYLNISGHKPFSAGKINYNKHINVDQFSKSFNCRISNNLRIYNKDFQLASAMLLQYRDKLENL